MVQVYPNKQFYIKKISQIPFETLDISKEIKNRNIDIEYRMKEMEEIIPHIDLIIEQEQKRSKTYELLNIPKENIQTKNQKVNNIEIEELEFETIISSQKYSIKSPLQKRSKKGTHINQIKTEQSKIASGKLGEKIVYDYERKKLKQLGLDYLANNVKWITKTEDKDITFDGLGYDIISYNEKKEKIYIEVKTSKKEQDTAFYISKKEIDLMNGKIENIDTNHAFIYYVSKINKELLLAEIKIISADEFNKYELEPTIFKIKKTN